jgi:hypothetical protein
MILCFVLGLMKLDYLRDLSVAEWVECLTYGLTFYSFTNNLTLLCVMLLFFWLKL